MDDFYNVKRLALVLAVQAEIEGMKVANTVRFKDGLAPAYTKEDFSNKSFELENLAHANNDQL
jgi:hypothetical protein